MHSNQKAAEVTYKQMKAIRCAERMIRKLCGVGYPVEDFKNHNHQKAFRKTHMGERARVLCEELLSIGQPN